MQDNISDIIGVTTAHSREGFTADAAFSRKDGDDAAKFEIGKNGLPIIPLESAVGKQLEKLTLEKLWPLSAVDAIESNKKAAWAMALREELGEKPESKSSLSAWVEKAAVIRALYQDLMSPVSPKDRELLDRVLAAEKFFTAKPAKEWRRMQQNTGPLFSRSQAQGGEKEKTLWREVEGKADDKLHPAAVTAALDEASRDDSERRDALREEFEKEANDNDTVDGREIDHKGLETDEEGEPTDEGWEEYYRRRDAAVEETLNDQFRPIEDIDDIDSYATARMAFNAASAYLKTAGINHSTYGGGYTSYYIEIYSPLAEEVQNLVELEETDPENPALRTIKLRFANHSNQSYEHSNTDWQWTEAGVGGGYTFKEMMQVATRFANGETDIGEQVHYSGEATTQNPSTLAAVTADIDAALGQGTAERLQQAGLLEIHEKASGLPADAKDAQGYFDPKTGKIHLIASNIAQGKGAAVLEHEGWHRFLDGMKGTPEHARLMNRLRLIEKSTANGDAGKWFKEAAEHIPESDKTNESRRLNELAAYAIEQYESAPRALPEAVTKWVQDFIANVKTWMTENLGFTPKTLTAADLAAVSRRFLRQQAAGERGQQEVGERGIVTFPAEGAAAAAYSLPDPESKSFRATEFEMNNISNNEVNNKFYHSQNTDRVYLNVPYSEKEQVKSLGAKWDKEHRSWYIPAELELDAAKKIFKKWMDIPQQLSRSEIEAQFSKSLTEAGLVIEDTPIMDSRWHRTTVSTSSKTKMLKGAYIARVDSDVPNGFIQNFDTGYKAPWFLKGAVLNNKQQLQYKQQIAENRAIQENELKQTQERVAARCAKKWASLQDADDTHPYLERKGVKAFGLKQDGDKLVTPIRDVDGKIWSLQYISADPDQIKMYEKNGRKNGNFHVLGNLEGAETVLFAEGYATCASLHMATRLPVVEVFDSGNFSAVFCRLWPYLDRTENIICADDDAVTLPKVEKILNNRIIRNRFGLIDGIGSQEILTAIGQVEKVTLQGNPKCALKLTLEHPQEHGGFMRATGEIINTETDDRLSIIINNIGQEKAWEAAQVYGAKVVAPNFLIKENCDMRGLTDFNDLHKHEGLNQVLTQIAAVADMERIRDVAVKAAKTLIGETVKMNYPHNNKRYVGPIVDNAGLHAVQNIGRQTAVAHPLSRLDRIPAIGTTAHIEYANGHGKVLNTPTRRERANELI
jgi:putative DNA primase/helicase